METVTDFFFLASKITADGDGSHEIKMLAPWKKSYDQPRHHIKKQRHYFADKGPYNQSYGFSYSQCSLEGLMLMLKLQYFGYRMRRADSFEKTLILGKIEGRRRRGQQRIRWLDGITDSLDMSLGRLLECWTVRPGVLQLVGLQRVRHNGATEQQHQN